MSASGTRKRLLFEFAITPDAIDAALSGASRPKRDALVAALRNISVNGLLANLRNGEWLSLVRERLGEAKDPEARRCVTECLNRLHDRARIVCHPMQSKGGGGTEWLAAALDSHHQFEMDGIFVDNAPRPHSGSHSTANVVIPVGEAQESTQWSCFGKRTEDVRKTVADYEQVLKTVLAYAKWVIVVDQYLLYGRRSPTMAAIEVISRLLGARRPRKSTPHATVLLHTAASRQRPDGRGTKDHYLQGWAATLLPLARRHQVQYLVYLDPVERKLHNRYIITNQCGVMTGDSIGCFPESAARSDDWTLLDGSIRDQRLSENDFRADPEARPYLEVSARGSRLVDL